MRWWTNNFLGAAFVVTLLLSTCSFSAGWCCQALDNGLARVPPLGWNAWNAFGCHNVTQDIMVQAADQIVHLGLWELGYQYVNLDDCWSARQRQRPANDKDDDNDKLIGDPTRFPKGLKWLGDYLHDRGLKFGIYASAGVETCAGFPGSLGYEQVDAETFALDWGVDYLKYDNCGNLGWPNLDRYVTMRNALNATGRPILYSLCQWGHESPWQWAPAVGNSWRVTGDLSPTWRAIRGSFEAALAHIDRAGPGAWADPDMLQVGCHGKLSPAEQRAHFAAWTLLKAPLLLGMDLRNVSQSVLDIITHSHLIAWHQHADTVPITRVHGRRNDDGDDEFAIYASRSTTLPATLRTSPTGVKKFPHETQSRVLLPTNDDDSPNDDRLVVEQVVVALIMNWGEFPEPAQTVNFAQFLGLAPFPKRQVVTIQDWYTHEFLPVIPRPQRPKENTTFRTNRTAAISSTPTPIRSSHSSSSLFGFTYDDLRHVPIPTLDKHSNLVLQFSLLSVKIPLLMEAAASS
ncbi:hypothetical protein ACA910_007564 [Epithemia clementina (nom. ined.)]